MNMLRSFLNRKMVKECIVVGGLILVFAPPLLSYYFREIPVAYTFTDTSVLLDRSGVNSFAAYHTQDGDVVLGASKDGVVSYGLWDDGHLNISSTSTGAAPVTYFVSEWAHFADANPSVLALVNRTPIEVDAMIDSYHARQFSIGGITIDDTVLLSSNRGTTFVYVSYRQSLYVYNTRGEYVNSANISALGYGEIESVDCGTDKAVISTVSGFGVFDPLTNSTISHLISPGEIYATRQATACDDECKVIYIGMKDGLHIYFRSDGEFSEVDHLTRQQGLPHDSVTCLWYDHAARRLFIGTEQGIASYDTDSGKAIMRFLETPRVTAVYSQGNAVFAATDTGFYVIGREQLEVVNSFWEQTSTLWTSLWIPMWAFMIAAIALLKETPEKAS